MNPFLNAANNPSASLGVYHDADGAWNVQRSVVDDRYVLTQGDQVKYVDSRMFDSQCRALYDYGYSQEYVKRAAYCKPRRRTLTERWNDRMLRLAQKERERQIRLLVRAGWYIGLTWGSLAVFVITSYLLKWTTKVVLG